MSVQVEFLDNSFNHPYSPCNLYSVSLRRAGGTSLRKQESNRLLVCAHEFIESFKGVPPTDTLLLRVEGLDIEPGRRPGTSGGDILRDLQETTLRGHYVR